VTSLFSEQHYCLSIKCQFALIDNTVLGHAVVIKELKRLYILIPATSKNYTELGISPLKGSEDNCRPGGK